MEPKTSAMIGRGYYQGIRKKDGTGFPILLVPGCKFPWQYKEYILAIQIVITHSFCFSSRLESGAARVRYQAGGDAPTLCTSTHLQQSHHLGLHHPEQGVFVSPHSGLSPIPDHTE